MRPFSAPSPGATPALRGMIESDRSLVLTGISVLDGAGYLGASTRVGRRFYAIWENFHKVVARPIRRMRDARRGLGGLAALLHHFEPLQVGEILLRISGRALHSDQFLD